MPAPNSRHATFATRLRVVRAQRPEITQQTVAEQLGCSQNAISKWEKGMSQPSADHIAGICDLFGVSADYLIGRTDSPTGLTPGQWIIDLDAVERPDPLVPWAAEVPRRHRIVDHREKERIRESRRGKP